MNLFKRLFGRAIAAVDPEPDPFAQPDQTDAAYTMDHLINAMGENRAVPREGDVVIRLTSCSMGMSVRRDDRFRVTGPGRQNGVSVEVPVINAKTGAVDHLSVWYMRQHTKLARTWWLLD